MREQEYARSEREKRFLLADPPKPSAIAVTRLIRDRLIRDRSLEGTRLPLRRSERRTPDLPPARCVAEVTDDVRFTGGILVSASRR
ncbi:hypothetical protein [Streptomyces zaehneri]|uniref:hypothetical protein n=1 Tax=Streptomyces zaehneri TaxID=3051180 RepID=UPI0028D22977|nr:hypothetical protein [Streptomyces sp. DSM 40713]